MAAKRPRPAQGLWLLVYGIIPEQPRKLLKKVAAILGAEDRIARAAGRSWTGGLVSESRDGPVTHVLIVSDSERRDSLIHLALEAELKQLAVDVLITLPMAVPQRQT